MMKDKDGDIVEFKEVVMGGEKIYMATYTECSVKSGTMFAILLGGMPIGFGETIGKALAHAYLMKHTLMKLATEIRKELNEKIEQK